jgi:hypothetical protein
LNEIWVCNPNIKSLGQQKREVFDWLGPVDPSINHSNAVKLHEPETGEWIFGHEKYKEWESKENAALWIHAKRIYHIDPRMKPH